MGGLSSTLSNLMPLHDFSWVNLETDHFDASRGEFSCQRQTDIAKSENTNDYVLLLKFLLPVYGRRGRLSNEYRPTNH